jgi:hypothetical protein
MAYQILVWMLGPRLGISTIITSVGGGWGRHHIVKRVGAGGGALYVEDSLSTLSKVAKSGLVVFVLSYSITHSLIYEIIFCEAPNMKIIQRIIPILRAHSL